MGSTVFENCNVSNATLKVLSTSVSLYKAADQWKEFGTIEGLPTLNLTDETPSIAQGSYSPGDATYTRPVTAGNYASFCMPFEVDLSEAVGLEKVYIPMEQMIYNTNTQWLMMFLKEQSMTSTIAAGTPFLAKTNGSEVKMSNSNSVTYSEEVTTNPEAKQISVFNYDGKSGVLYENTSMNVSWGGTYIATEATEGMNSFNVDGTFGQHTGTLNPFRAYVMQTLNAGAAKVNGITVNFNDGEATAILGVMAEKKNSTDAIYNLQGQKVNTMQSGNIYIVNGKKVVR